MYIVLGNEGSEQPKDIEPVDLEAYDSGVVHSVNESDLAPLLRASLNAAAGISIDTDSKGVKDDDSDLELQDKMEGLNLSEDEDEDDWETASGEFTESETEIQISPKSDNHNINNRKGTCKLKYVLVPFFYKIVLVGV